MLLSYANVECFRGRPNPGDLPELCVAGRRSRTAHLRRTARRGPRGMVRPECAARRRRVGRVDPPADQGMCAVRAGRLGEHAGARGGLFPARVEPGSEPHAGHGRRQGVPAAGRHRCHAGREGARAREIPGGAMDAPARGRRAGGLCRTRASAAVGRRCTLVAGHATARRAGDSGGRCRCHPRTVVDRGAAFREPQPRRGRRVLFGWPRRRAAQRTGKDPRAASGGALVGLHVQGQRCNRRRSGPGAQRCDSARRQRAQGRQPDAHLGAAGEGCGRLSPLVGDLRPDAGGHLCRAGRHRTVGGEGTAHHAAGRGGRHEGGQAR